MFLVPEQAARIMENVVVKITQGVTVSIMAKSRAKKIIQVPIEDELLERIDATASTVAESRAAFIREACKQRLKSFKERELDRRYMEGYRKKPEELDWAEASVRLLSKRLPKEKW